MEQKETKNTETKICKHCQSEIPKKAKVCPVCRKKQKKGIVKWIIIAILAIFVFSAIFGGGEDSDKPSDSNPKKVGETGEKGEESKKEESKVFSVGDVVETSNFKIKFLSAKKYNPDNEYDAPKKGNVIYEMQFEFENVSDSDWVVSTYDFKCYADGYDTEQRYFDGLDLDANLSPGKKTKGSVFFEMPKDTKESTLEYETNFWTEDKVVFEVK